MKHTCLGCKILMPILGIFLCIAHHLPHLPGIDYPCGLVASTATDLSFLMVLWERQNHFFVRETNRHDLYIYIYVYLETFSKCIFFNISPEVESFQSFVCLRVVVLDISTIDFSDHLLKVAHAPHQGIQ